VCRTASAHPWGLSPVAPALHRQRSPRVCRKHALGASCPHQRAWLYMLRGAGVAQLSSSLLAARQQPCQTCWMVVGEAGSSLRRLLGWLLHAHQLLRLHTLPLSSTTHTPFLTLRPSLLLLLHLVSHSSGLSHRARWARAAALAALQADPWAARGIDRLPLEAARRHRYNPASTAWVVDTGGVWGFCCVGSTSCTLRVVAAATGQCWPSCGSDTASWAYAQCIPQAVGVCLSCNS
jgi:hypothetical protein